MLGTSVEDIAQFLHQEERLDSVRLGVGRLSVGFIGFHQLEPRAWRTLSAVAIVHTPVYSSPTYSFGQCCKKLPRGSCVLGGTVSEPEVSLGC